jgi:P27 family predicted phage terminase small subunit
MEACMVRGRKADPHQAAKGYPNRRKSKVQRREEEAQRVADLLVAASSRDNLSPPDMIDQGPLYAGAVAVWRVMAPRLVRTNRLSEQHRLIFAMFCVYYADWVTLNDQLKLEGMTQTVRTVSGSNMIRQHPAVRLMQQCFDNCMKLSQQFGLTPHDEYDLFKNQSLAAALNPGLFAQAGAPKVEQDVPAAPAAENEIGVGMLGRMNSAPPAQLN